MDVQSLIQLLDEDEKEPQVVQIQSDPKAGGVQIVNEKGNAIMMTGATHARELLSMQVPLYMCLKLLHQGILNKKDRYVNMLRTTKFFFIPVVNVDGSALVEQHWVDDGKIIDKRKNQSPTNFGSCGYENSGVDINRNFGIDWKAQN